MRQRAVMLSACLATSVVMQCWVISQAVLPAQDVVRFVSLAEAIDSQGLLATVRDQAEQPLFPWWLSLVHRYCPGQPNWFESAQIAAAVPTVLAILPLFFLIECLLSRRAACAGCLLFAVMSHVARLGADGLSDSLHLLLFATALMAQIFYWKQPGSDANSDTVCRDAGRVYTQPAGRQLGWALLCGFCLALAVLVREEALVLLALWPVSLIAIQIRSAWRTSWQQHAISTLTWAAAFAVVWLPYLSICNPGSLRTAAAAMLGQEEFAESDDTQENSPAAARASTAPVKKRTKRKRSRWRLPSGARMDFAKKEYSISKRFEGALAAGGKLSEDLLHLFRWGVGLPLLLGVWSTRHWNRRPVHRVAMVFVLLYLCAVYAAAVQKGYLSERHLLPLVLLGVGWAGQGAIWLAERTCQSPALLGLVSLPRRQALQTGTAVAMVGVLMLACLPRTLSPLHSSRANHQRAGSWLCHAPAGAVLDTRGWAGHLAQRRTYDFDQARHALADPELSYVIVERRELEYGSSRSQTLQVLLSRGAEQIAVFETTDQNREAVLVYRWHPQRFALQGTGRMAN